MTSCLRITHLQAVGCATTSPHPEPRACTGQRDVPRGTIEYDDVDAGGGLCPNQVRLPLAAPCRLVVVGLVLVLGRPGEAIEYEDDDEGEDDGGMSTGTNKCRSKGGGAGPDGARPPAWRAYRVSTMTPWRV
jgi:hypothetical protein